MRPDSTVLSLDAGTSSIKAVLAQRNPQGGWQVLAHIAEPIAAPTTVGGIVGSSEQDAEAWWRAALLCIKGLLARVSVRVDAIALSGQMQSVVLLDAQLMALRPALLYSDTRATAEAEELEASLTHARLVAEASNWKGAASTVPKLRWLLAHEPRTVADCASIALSAHDFLFGRLTGIGRTDPTNASVTGMLDARSEASWASQLLADAGLPAALVAKLPQVSRGRALNAALTEAAAAALGDGRAPSAALPAGTPVCLGSGDLGSTTIGALGSSEGGTYCYLGTSGWVATVRRVRDGAPPTDAFSVSHPLADLRILAAPMTTAGGNVAWLRRLLYPGMPEVDALAAIEKEARDAPPGCDGLLYLPYLQGERCPVSDPAARAGFVGIGPTTSRAHLCRAVLEGLAFAVRSLLALLPPDKRAYTPHAHMLRELSAAIETAQARGEGSYACPSSMMLPAAPPPLVLVGGVANSRVAAEMLADVLQREVRVPRAPSHVPGLGAASLAVLAALKADGAAAKAADDAPSAAPEASGASVEPERTFQPNDSLRAVYDAAFERWSNLYPSLKTTFASRPGGASTQD